MARLVLLLWDWWFGEPLRKLEAEALAFRQSDAGRRADRKTIAVLLTAAACLTVQNYTDHPNEVAPAVGFVARTVSGPDAGRAVVDTLDDWDSDPLSDLTWWVTVTILAYTVVPLAVIKLGFRERLRDYGVKARGALAGWKVYLVFVAVMVPLVAVFSGESRFQATYPFYRVTSAGQVNGGLLRWELLYAVQFVALEFFFRGFLLHGTKHRFGTYAVFVMTVPYCMIHYGKPMPEACASIVAGVALGLVSLATRSIWLGAALHISVAWGMDFACLTRRGLLFG